MARTGTTFIKRAKEHAKREKRKQKELKRQQRKELRDDDDIDLGNNAIVEERPMPLDLEEQE